MKFPFLPVFLLVFGSCNNQAAGLTVKDDAVVDVRPTATGNDCGSGILFKKGSRLTTESSDANGKLLASSVSQVTSVTDAGGVKMSEVQITSTSADQKEPFITTGKFRCDGGNLVMDLTAFMQSKAGMQISSEGVSFPGNPKTGSTLPDASYTVSVAYGGKEMKMLSTITDRKVEAKEELTTPAGTFTVYRITSTINVKTEMAGLTPEMQKEMEAARAKMGKNTMTFWYDPAVSIIKTEIYIGGKLTISSLLTSLK